MKNFRSRQKGVAEVLGALLLMLVVVIAVGTFAFYLSSLQTQGEQRNSFLNSVKNDKIQVTNLQLFPSNPNVMYELNFSNSINYIQMVNSQELNIYNWTDSNQPYTVVLATPDSVGNDTQQGGVYYNMIGSGIQAQVVCAPAGFAKSITACPAGPFATSIVINIPSICGTACNIEFLPATWYSANVTVRDLNTQSTGVSTVKINAFWLNNFYTSVSTVLQPHGVFSSNQTTGYNVGNPLYLGAENSETLYLNLTSLTIPKDASLSFTILSTAGNYFSSFYSAPTSLIQSSVNPNDENIYIEDIPTFTGIQSSDLNGTVQSYMWQMNIHNTTLASVYVSSPAFEYIPDGSNFFTSAELQSAKNSALSIDGSFNITLITVNQYGIMSNPSSFTFAADSQISPITTISPLTQTGGMGDQNDQSEACSVTPTTQMTLTVSVDDLFGRSAPDGTHISVVPYGGAVSLDAVDTSIVTTSGVATITIDSCTTGAAIGVTYGNLPPTVIPLT